jgi:ATP-binding cassette subfamily F protein 3
LKVLQRTWEKQQEFIARTEDFIRRNAYGQKATQAKDREKKLERLERVKLPPDFSEIPMGFPEPGRTGDWVLRTERLSKGFAPIGAPSGTQPAPLFSNLTIQIDRGDRVGILGPNGSGKTTLLRTLVGELTPDAGTVRYGTGVRVAYFDQQLGSVDSTLDAVEAVRAPAPEYGDTPFAQPHPDLKPGSIRGWLAKFGVSGELGTQQVGAMSGGERTKVALARLSAQHPNLMVLDEPTNHLDFWACAALERSLREFEGTVLFVSHDRYFVDQIATKVIVLEPHGWRLHEGNYTDYQHFLAATGASVGTKESEPEKKSSAPASIAGANAKDQPRRKRKFPYRPVEDIESDIADCEAEIASLENDMANPAVHRDGARMRVVQADYSAAKHRLGELMEHWDEALELN